MNFALVEIEELSGKRLKVYSVLPENSKDDYSLYDNFMEENWDQFEDELNDIFTRIETMAKETGIREDFIKSYEGNLGDGIHALYDKPKSKLRLYFIRYGNVAIVLGGGGLKPKNTRALQETPQLLKANTLLRNISAALTKAVQQGTLSISDEGLMSTTNFNYSTK